jgi:hypothetical protein
MNRASSMNLTFIGNNNADDFLIVDNHAQISQLKVAEITQTNQSTVSRWYALTTVRQDSKVKGEYLSGYALKEFVTYLVLDAKRITKEVRQHNVKLLSDASDYGFQMLIDKMAGLTVSKQENADTDEITPEMVTHTIDLIFKGVNIKPELIAGVKLNAIAKLNPQLASLVNDSQKLLTQSTASDSKLMTPTALGKQLNISGQKVNKLLIDTGLQIKNDNRKSRKEPSYLPTDKGHEFCSFTLATGQKEDNTTYQQLLWYESVLNLIC